MSVNLTTKEVALALAQATHLDDIQKVDALKALQANQVPMHLLNIYAQYELTSLPIKLVTLALYFEIDLSKGLTGPWFATPRKEEKHINENEADKIIQIAMAHYLFRKANINISPAQIYLPNGDRVIWIDMLTGFMSIVDDHDSYLVDKVSNIIKRLKELTDAK